MPENQKAGGDQELDILAPVSRGIGNFTPIDSRNVSIPAPLKSGIYQDAVNVRGVEISWDVTKGLCNFRGIPVAMMWTDSSLASLMASMASMVGPERFNLALQAEGRKSIESDWLLVRDYDDFNEGFRNLSHNAKVAGWGDWQLISYDPDKMECRFRGYHGWEGAYQRSLGVCWGSGMMGGKLAGICGKLFDTNCWAVQTYFDAKGDGFDEFVVSPSPKNIEEEIDNLLTSDEATKADMAVALKKLQHLAHFDALTGLPNRALLADRLQQAMMLSQRHNSLLGVIFLDIDGFKEINDNYGHSIGDELLIAISKRMKAALREIDSLSRFGGDEFVAVIGDLQNTEDAEPLLKRLLLAVSQPVYLNGVELQVSGSIGVTFYPTDGVDADQLIRHADQAMYIAKQSGKNRYHFFDVNQDLEIKTRRESQSEIQLGFKRNEFVLHYQPQINMRTGEVCGVEALIRWQHPERGLLPPAAFLPIIEDQPLIVEIGEWVIATALAQSSAWRKLGLDLAVSVNIGPREVQQSDFVDRLSALLAAHPEIKPGQLKLEILETSALEDIEMVSKNMRNAVALGVEFALDDFGTGFSSLTYLKRLPAKQLKIDQSFVRDMLSDVNDLSIVNGVLGLAAAFGIEVVAEGVEAEDHGELLLALGCELAQGYGIARPMPASDIPEWVMSRRPNPRWSAWHNRSLTQDDLLLIFSKVQLRTWLQAIELHLLGGSDVPASMHQNDCHFRRWRQKVGEVHFSTHPEYLAAINLHKEIHLLGNRLVASHGHSNAESARAELEDLRMLVDQLIGILRQLLYKKPCMTDKSKVCEMVCFCD